MLKNVVIIVFALVLIGIGFVWGLDSNTPVAGNEEVIRAEQVHADIVTSTKFNLVDDSGNHCGFFSAGEDGTVMISLGTNQDIVMGIIDNKPNFYFRNGNDRVQIMMDDDGPNISLWHNNEMPVLISAVDGEGIVITTDSHGKVTGSVPR